MFWLALALLGDGSDFHRPMSQAPVWSASPVVARMDAKRNRSAIIVIAGQGQGQSSRYAFTLGESAVRNFARQYSMLQAINPGNYDGLTTSNLPSFGTHLAIVSPEGDVWARINGGPRVKDLRRFLQQMQAHLEGRPLSMEARVRYAMAHQNDAEAQDLAGQSADGHGAIADELRVRGSYYDSLEEYEKAVRLSTDISQRARWTLRLAGLQWRMGQADQVGDRLQALLQSPGLDDTDRQDVNQILGRFMAR